MVLLPPPAAPAVVVVGCWTGGDVAAKAVVAGAAAAVAMEFAGELVVLPGASLAGEAVTAAEMLDEIAPPLVAVGMIAAAVTAPDAVPREGVA